MIRASLVWYGVLGLWCQLGESAASPTDAASVRRRVSEILFGFAFIHRLIDGPGFPKGSVEPAIVELIGRLSELAAALGAPPDTEVTLAEAMRSSENGGWVPISPPVPREWCRARRQSAR